MRLVDLVKQQTAVDFNHIMLLRHSTRDVKKVRDCGASVEEWTSIQPIGKKYDYWADCKPRIHIVVVVVHDQVFAVYRVLGVEAEGPRYSLASETLRQSYFEREREDRPARRFTMKSVSCAATGAPITGWKGKEINPVARSDGNLFWEIEVNVPYLGVTLPDQQGDRDRSDEDASYSPQEGDRRQIVERQIRERRGQQQFRDDVRKRYGNRCVVTGCDILAVLEAAHISPYRGENDNHPENGLLLRSDIHTLFDLDLLGIEPEHLRVELHPDVVKEYGCYRNVTLGCAGGQRPSRAALRLRYEQFRRRGCSPCGGLREVVG